MWWACNKCCSLHFSLNYPAEGKVINHSVKADWTKYVEASYRKQKFGNKRAFQSL